MDSHIEQQIIAKLHGLDDFSLQELLDFIDFLHQRRVKPVVTQPNRKQPRKPGSAKNLLKIHDDFDAPLDDFRDYMS